MSNELILFLIFVALPFIILFWVKRINRKNLLNLEYEYKIYKLRDDLRWFDVNNQVGDNRDLFQYLDESLSRNVKTLSLINFYTLFGLYIVHRRDNKLAQFRKVVHNELTRKDNGRIKEIYNAYSLLVFEYLVKKHRTFHYFVSLFIFVKIFKTFLGKINNKEKVTSFLYYPETSASPDYLNII